MVKIPGGQGGFEADITQISLGKFKIGITGLKEAIERAQVLQGQPEEEIARALLDELKTQNYIPAGSADEYKRAFLREFKKARGERMEEQAGPVIEILGPGCPNCHRLEQMVLEILSELELPAQVERVREVNQIAARGIWGTPALLVNGEVKSVGRLPPREILKKWLANLQA
jgi:small redox-active disulfide protein 2